MYITICETDDQCKFSAWSWALKASALGQPMGWDGEGGGRGIQDEDTYTPMAFYQIKGSEKSNRKIYQILFHPVFPKFICVKNTSIAETINILRNSFLWKTKVKTLMYNTI